MTMLGVKPKIVPKSGSDLSAKMQQHILWVMRLDGRPPGDDPFPAGLGECFRQHQIAPSTPIRVKGFRLDHV
jgi:hypothetical protein